MHWIRVEAFVFTLAFLERRLDNMPLDDGKGLR